MKKVEMPLIFQPFRCENLIRLGKENDGGYLVNKLDVEKSNVLISFGIGNDVSFEEDFHKMNQLSIFAYDNTIENINSECIKHLYLAINKTNIDEILKSHEKIFLKCDIDGSEYEILESLIEHSHRFIGGVFEFHNITNTRNYHRLTNFISKIEMRLIHIHINNYFYYINENECIPDIIELTFSTSRENTAFTRYTVLPNRLDMPNNPNDEDFEVVFERI
jgi:hypothetical protein